MSFNKAKIIRLIKGLQPPFRGIKVYRDLEIHNQLKQF